MAITYVETPEQLRGAPSPVRQDLLKRLRTPSSASQLAAALELPRRRLNYAAEHPVGVAATTVRGVARIQGGAEQADKRLPTYTLKTEVQFARPLLP